MANENPSNAALSMDRGLPLGNSEDIFLRRALHVKVANKLNEPINVNVVDGPSYPPETVIETYNEVLSVASGTEIIINTYTVPFAKIAKLQKIEYSGSNTAEYRYYKNGTVTGFKRTHHGSGLSGEFVFFSGSEEGIPLATGDVIKITAKHIFRQSGDFEARFQIIEIG